MAGSCCKELMTHYKILPSQGTQKYFLCVTSEFSMKLFAASKGENCVQNEKYFNFKSISKQTKNHAFYIPIDKPKCWNTEC